MSGEKGSLERKKKGELVEMIKSLQDELEAYKKNQPGNNNPVPVSNTSDSVCSERTLSSLSHQQV